MSTARMPGRSHIVGESWPGSRRIVCDADPTTASYSRTMYAADGAFKRSPQYAHAIKRTGPAPMPRADRVVLVAVLVLAVVFAALWVCGALPGGGA